MFIDENLYKQIVAVMPIPCVDLIVENEFAEILLVKRVNDPAKGEWWFPGGRVNYKETRIEAAKRKLFQECGLVSNDFEEIGTFDLFLGESNESHGITTVYKTKIIKQEVKLDKQSSEFKWNIVNKSLKNNSHEFIRKILLI